MKNNNVKMKNNDIFIFHEGGPFPLRRVGEGRVRELSLYAGFGTSAMWRSFLPTTLVAQLASAFTFGVGGPWIKADLWQHFPRPAPTQEMAVTGECSLGRGD